MAILASIQAVKDKILLKIKGLSTGNAEKTKAIDHREVLIDAVDTLNDKINSALISYYKANVILSSDDQVVSVTHGLGSIDIDVKALKHISSNDRESAPIFSFSTLNPTIVQIDFKDYLAGDEFTVITQKF